MAAAPVDVPLPRSFKLLEEYDCAIGKKGKTLLKGQHANFIQYGLADDGDMDLATWRATIIGPQGKQIGEFIYMLELVCGPDYPQTPPRVKFQAPRLAMPAVGQDGSVRATVELNHAGSHLLSFAVSLLFPST
jgi:ubiquitin-conjugating enzyme E2 variant